MCAKPQEEKVVVSIEAAWTEAGRRGRDRGGAEEPRHSGGVGRGAARREPRGTEGQEARAAESVSVVLEDSPLAF